MGISKVRLKEDIHLERGGVLRNPEIAFSTFGTLNETRDNVIWVCHALTANSDVADWWPNTVVAGGFLDPSKWFVVCANILGSHYGTTGPLSLNPDSGKPYFLDFPKVTIRDMVKAHQILATHLRIDRIHALVGSSLGGFQALEWAIMEPERIDRLILIATDAVVTPWAAGFNETQRMTIKADASFGEKNPEAGKAGMAAARAIALLSYRGAPAYNISQQNRPDTPQYCHRVATYQNYQGEKLCNRFDAYSYMAILDAFDTHDVGRNRGSVAEALRSVRAKTACIGITTDILFRPQEVRALAGAIPGATYYEISSEFGHDGFLVEHAQLNKLLNEFLKS